MATWEGVTEFVAVAQSKGFTAAAKQLSTSVAQVSRRVAALESRLGVKLFIRTTRKTTLTEVGEVYFSQCKGLLDELAQAEHAVIAHQNEPKGKIKLTAPVTYGERQIAPLLNQFLLQYPQIELELVLTNDKLDLLASGIDIAIRLGNLEASDYIAQRLSSRQLYVCASHEYLQSMGTPTELAHLASHHCLVGSVDRWRFRTVNKDITLPVAGRLKCNSGFALLDAAKSGLGIVQLPDFYVDSALKDGSLVEVLGSYRAVPEGIWALYPNNRARSLKHRLVADFLSLHLPTV